MTAITPAATLTDGEAHYFGDCVVPNSTNLSIYTPNKALEASEHPVAVGLRALIAAIPFVGGSISVLVESRLANIQVQRVDELYKRIYEIQSTLSTDPEPSRATPPFSESLLEHAVSGAREVTDEGRPRIVANLLYTDARQDPAEALRRHLIDIALVITPLELALLLNLSDINLEALKSTLAVSLFKINVLGSDISELREFSMRRLFSFGLVSSAADTSNVTAIGQKFANAVIQ